MSGKVLAIFILSFNVINLQGQSYFTQKIDFQSVRNYFWENPQYIIGAATFGILAYPFYCYYTRNQKNQSKEDLKEVQKRLFAQSDVSKKSITMMYKMIKVHPLYISQEKLKNLDNKPVKLKYLFEKYNIITGLNLFTKTPKIEWSSDDWQNAYTTLALRAEGNKNTVFEIENNEIMLQDLPKLLKDAKSILRSFIPPEPVATLKSDFIRKQGINRLFTYAKLKQVIEEKKLSHIHLPLKILVIRDMKSGKDIVGDNAKKILDEIIKIMAFNSTAVDIMIDELGNANYEFIIFSHKEIKTNKPLNRNAYNQLKILLNEAPFDVGNDNIFTDENGDAIIIDTEFKGAPADASIEKLERYPKEF